MQRRRFLRVMALSGSAFVQPPWSLPRDFSVARAQPAAAPAKVDSPQTGYGRWVARDNLPAFAYDVDQDTLPYAEWDPIIAPPTRRNWLMVGNQAVRLQAGNDGTVALFDEAYGLRWLTAPDPAGTGVSIVDDTEPDPTRPPKQWGTEYSQRAGEQVPIRTFGPTWFEVEDTYAGLGLIRTILCPEGEVPWLLVHVRLMLSANAAARTITHTEHWALRPRFLNVFNVWQNPLAYRIAACLRRWQAEWAVSYNVKQSAAGLIAEEQFASVDDPWPAGEAAKHLIGPPAILVLERLGNTAGTASHRFDPSSPHPILEIKTSLALKPGEARDLWFRFGRQDNSPPPQPDGLLSASLALLSKRLPTAAAPLAPEAAQEIAWHGALLTGGAAVDHVIGGHSLDQGSAYSYSMGFNGAARDPLQHALPLIYTQPDLALSVLRNTCAWATPEGELPYALDGAKLPTTLDALYKGGFQPSDSNLWALWLASEYAAVTGDLAAFDALLAYHPIRKTEAVPLWKHLQRQFRFFVGFIDHRLHRRGAAAARAIMCAS
jgi:hypothetical protein